MATHERETTEPIPFDDIEERFCRPSLIVSKAFVFSDQKSDSRAFVRFLSTLPANGLRGTGIELKAVDRPRHCQPGSGGHIGMNRRLLSDLRLNTDKLDAVRHVRSMKSERKGAPESKLS